MYIQIFGITSRLFAVCYIIILHYIAWHDRYMAVQYSTVQCSTVHNKSSMYILYMTCHTSQTHRSLHVMSISIYVCVPITWAAEPLSTTMNQGQPGNCLYSWNQTMVSAAKSQRGNSIKKGKKQQKVTSSYTSYTLHIQLYRGYTLLYVFDPTNGTMRWLLTPGSMAPQYPLAAGVWSKAWRIKWMRASES